MQDELPEPGTGELPEALHTALGKEHDLKCTEISAQQAEWGSQWTLGWKRNIKFYFLGI